MKINFNEMKKDVKDGYYEILDCKEVSKKFYLTVLNENDSILIHIDNYNTMTQGFYRIDVKEFLAMKKDDFIKFINHINYYCDEPIESNED